VTGWQWFPGDSGFRRGRGVWICGRLRHQSGRSETKVGGEIQKKKRRHSKKYSWMKRGAGFAGVLWGVLSRSSVKKKSRRGWERIVREVDLGQEAIDAIGF